MKPAVLYSGFVQVQPDTHPETIAEAAQPADRIQFDKPLPDFQLAAIADAVREHPHVGVRAYGREVDPTLVWLRHFRHVRRLAIDLWLASSFDPIRELTELRSLSLGETKSKKPSLAILADLPHIERLWLEGHGRDFQFVGTVRGLKSLSLRVNPAKSLDPLAGHSALSRLSISFGGIRNLEPLA